MANPLIVHIHEALGELIDQPPMYLKRVHLSPSAVLQHHWIKSHPAPVAKASEPLNMECVPVRRPFGSIPTEDRHDHTTVDL